MLLKIIRLYKPAPFIVTLLLICISVCSSGQPSYVLHKPYGVQFLAVDSIYYQLKNEDSITIIKEINRLENWSREQNDLPLYYAFHLLTFRYSSTRCKKNNTEVETRLPLFIKELNKHKLPLLKAEAMTVFADYCWNSYKTAGLAFEYSLNAYSIYNTVTATDFPTKSFDLYNLGINFSRFKDYRGAIKYLNEAAATKPIYREIRVFNIYNALGLSYRNAEIYDSAEFCFKKAYSIIDTNKNIVWAGIINGNLGITYYYQKKYSEAIPLLEKDISICIQRRQVKNAAKSLAILGDIYLIKGDKQKAQALLKQSYQLIQDGGKWEDYELLQSVYPILARVYAANGQPAVAYAFLDSTMKVKDSIASLKNVLTVARTQQKIQEERYALEVQKAEDAKEINIIIRNSLIIGIVLFTLIAVLFINRLRLKYNQKQEKLESEKLLAEAAKDLAENELTHAGKQLSDFTRSIHEKNELIEKFSEEIERLQALPCSVEIPDSRENLVKLQQSTILTDEQWEDFRSLFEKVHTGYLLRLREKLPDLSPAETRFIALSKLKLSNKEMAGILGISTDAVRMNKHRLLKKLNLPDDGNLEQLIETI